MMQTSMGTSRRRKQRRRIHNGIILKLNVPSAKTPYFLTGKFFLADPKSSILSGENMSLVHQGNPFQAQKTIYQRSVLIEKSFCTKPNSTVELLIFRWNWCISVQH